VFCSLTWISHRDARLRIDYLRPAGAAGVRATCYHTSKNVAFTARSYRQRGQLIASSSGTFARHPQRRGRRGTIPSTSRRRGRGRPGTLLAAILRQFMGMSVAVVDGAGDDHDRGPT
jgi:hypothetical protein